MVKQIGEIKLYSIQDLTESLGLTPRTLRGWFNQGKLKGVKVGKQWYVSEDNLRKFFNAEEGGDIKKKKGKRKLRNSSKHKEEEA